MKILSIETSCDETAVSIVEAQGGLSSPSFVILGNALLSQINIHKEYGGVYPMMAKREHAKNLAPLLQKAMSDARMFNSGNAYEEKVWQEVEKLLEREEGLYKDFREKFENIKKPDIDVIAVTEGPGLAPALWVGISFAKALSLLWEIPVIGVNHMEGHISSVLVESSDKEKINFPALALLISGGHTELVEIKNWGNYKILGQTRDDAVGEAFDKTARMLELPYPGGPEVGKLAKEAREKNIPRKATFSRPMVNSKDFDFSFSGLKTAVLYYIRDNGPLSTENKKDVAREFEDTIVDVLVSKTEKAIEEVVPKTLIVAGGVVANQKLREAFIELVGGYEGLNLKIPAKELATDNSLMIASAAYINLELYPELLREKRDIMAMGNLRLGKIELK